MTCSSCAKLASFATLKSCAMCNGKIHSTTMIICNFCSDTKGQCSGCLKKIVNKNLQRGCNCK
jgi:hypothetical protein